MLTLLPSAAQAFADAQDRVFAVKVQQPRKGWEAIYRKAEDAFAVIAEHYALQSHRRGHFKTHAYGLTMGNGSEVRLRARFK